MSHILYEGNQSQTLHFLAEINYLIFFHLRFNYLSTWFKWIIELIT